MSAGLHHASASGTDLLFNCTFWAQPGLNLPPEPTDQKDVPEIPRFGRAFHKTMELHLNPLRTAPLIESDIDEIAELFLVDHKQLREYYARGSIAIDKLLESRGWLKLPRLIEVKLAYDPGADRCRALIANDGERDYSGRRPTELPGTADLGLYRGNSKPLICLDYKSGLSSYDANTNPQLFTLSLAMSRYWSTHVEADKVTPKNSDEIAAILFIFRIDSEFIEINEGKVTFGQLEQHRLKLKRALHSAMNKPAMQPGMHCRWCKALEVCPAHQAPLTIVDQAAEMLEPQHVAHVYERLVAAENLLKKVRENIKRYVSNNGPLLLNNGKIAKITEFETSTLSQSSIKRALGKLDGELLIAELRDRGCIERTPVKQLREVKDPSIK